MRTAIGLALLLSVLLSGVPGTAQIVDYWGFSDFPQTVGSGIVEVGFAIEIHAPLTYDPEGFQYTYAFEELMLAEVVPMGPATVYTYLGGFFNVYEDASFNATYDDAQCLVSDPATFTDGSLYLQAELDTLTWIYNSMTGRGSYDAVMTYTGGTHIDEIPLDCREGMMFGGTTDLSCTVCIPEGYDHRWDGQAFTIQGPSAVDSSTWGSVKTLFR
ncbi:MAG: hypothetical protein KAW17_11790 [Candidatus Eisenbacteria sp.]|nr:hypothetical protein [Candidatus Eisenbacteria bacterium]